MYGDKPSQLCYPVQTRSQRKNMIPPVSDTTESVISKKTNIHVGNNKACTIEQPKFLKPGKRGLGKYACFFPGANLDSIQRTFDAITQLGTRGAISGINVRNRLLSLWIRFWTYIGAVPHKSSMGLCVLCYNCASLLVANYRTFGTLYLKQYSTKLLTSYM